MDNTADICEELRTDALNSGASSICCHGCESYVCTALELCNTRILRNSFQQRLPPLNDWIGGIAYEFAKGRGLPRGDRKLREQMN